MPTPIPAAIVVLALAVLALAGPAPADPFRVCADPDDPPLTSSNPQERGFYLELADLIAARLGTPLELVFVRTDVGRRALRPTLLAGKCDAFFGLPVARRSAGGTIGLTRPILDLGYALVAPKGFVFRALADLDGKRVGVQHASTPQTVLSVRDAVELVTFRTAEEAVDALGRGEIEFAFVWGPTAGYRTARLGLAGKVTITSAKGLALRAPVAIGVRAGDEVLRERLDRALGEVEPAIPTLAERYHFPLDQPVDLEAPAPAGPPAPAAVPAGRVNPFHGDPAALTAGRTLFNVHCSHCHSPNAQSPDAQRDLRLLHTRYGEQVNEVFYTTVTQGRPAKGMPPWGPILNEETIWKIKTFLESVQRQNPG